MNVAPLAAAIVAMAAPSTSTANPCVAAIAAARSDLNQTGAAISAAQKQLATILLASHGRLNAGELRQAVAQLEQLDAAATAILPAGRLQRELEQRAAACERHLHGPAA